MFPYPSGAGLHVGHPLGYTTRDILARPNAFRVTMYYTQWVGCIWLPAEQYDIETGTHPKITTLQNIDRFRSQATLSH